ncbi:glycosyltransferase family 39 protein [Acetobacter sp. AN02]|uniref:glycosyltransferase family 39 protein n=1 Tax=Acetobacter sp. AN02 TaxID=2894186 RepID=UPI0024344533|nr:glycosyltransferase family 39 protein [Acetobacter sp. AN02]MDG6094311.1 glycosyltransferase family 39 protein [Acetobacter sp. AN02]
MNGRTSPRPSPDRAVLMILTGLLLARLLAAAVLPLTPDEAYYRTWAQSLQGGYQDHPFMVALWIRAGSLLCGDTALGVRLGGPLSAFAGTLLVMAAVRRFFPGTGQEERSIRAAALLNGTLALGLGSTLMTPDTPLLFFVTLFALACAHIATTERSRWWLLAGLAAGAGFDSKYTMLLPVAGLGLWALITRTGRKHLCTVWPWAGLGLAALLTAPVLLWNAGHGWVSFLKQGGRAGDWHPARAGQFLSELAGGQIGLATPLIFVFFVAGLVAMIRTRTDVSRLLLCVTLLPLLVFVQHALGDRVQANWPVLLYPFLAIAAVRAGLSWWRTAALSGFALGVLVLLQAATGMLPLNRHFDITLRQGGGWAGLASDLNRLVPDPEAVIVADEYGLASELAFRLPGRHIAGIDPRWEYLQFPAFICRPATPVYLLRSTRRRDAPEVSPARVVTEPQEITRARGGREAEKYRLYRLICPAAEQRIPQGVILPPGY